MQLQIDIGFDQLLKAVRTLPAGQLKLLKSEIEKKTKAENTVSNLETLLLNGPTATEKQIEAIENNRKSINKWRKTL